MGDTDEAKVDDPEVKSSSSALLNGYGTDYSGGGFKLSDASQSIVDASRSLLDCKSSVAPSEIPSYHPPPSFKSRSPSPERSLNFRSSSAPRRLTAPRLPRVDFDDKVLSGIEDRQPSWKQWQDSVKDSYHQAKRTVERNKDEAEFLESLTTRPVARRGLSPFRELESTGFIPARRFSTAYNNSSFLSPSASTTNVFAAGSGPYAAPAVERSQGIESRYRKPSEFEKLYEKRVSDIESRLIKGSCLPNIRSITAKEFRRAPEASSGSSSDQHDLDDYDFSKYAPRTYYTRPNRDDPDYFDFDLQHSVDLYRRPEGKFTARGSRPQEWETKLLGESSAKGSAPLSGYLFTKGETDWRQSNSSYLSAALRTPKFWEQRFTAIGSQVRDSNPISLESINRRRRELSLDRLEHQLLPSARISRFPAASPNTETLISRNTKTPEPTINYIRIKLHSITPPAEQHSKWVDPYYYNIPSLVPNEGASLEESTDKSSAPAATPADEVETHSP